MSNVWFLVSIQKYDKSADSLENVNENDRLVLVKNAPIHV